MHANTAFPPFLLFVNHMATGLSVRLCVHPQHFGIFLKLLDLIMIFYTYVHINKNILKKAKVSENLLQDQGHSRGSKATCTDFFVHF